MGSFIRGYLGLILRGFWGIMRWLWRVDELTPIFSSTRWSDIGSVFLLVWLIYELGYYIGQSLYLENKKEI